VGELLPSSRELRARIGERAPLDQLRSAALHAGLHTMRDEALALVHEGAIALEELPRLFCAEMLAGWADA
jgi:type II secretory ATPase GspE/PulE/Tfp pilus assembly ATPase PilB-like protein